ncbi:MAG: glycosyltransferase family 39 protein [Deltaproteobacteria bacterium]|nr:glycosyltransferase family 39 protein [Deltaproteobacteria bacterium]
MRESSSTIGAGGLERRDWIALGLLLAGAAAIRVVAWSQTAVLFNDGPIFLAMADALRAGEYAKVLAHPQHPLYPALVAVLEELALAPEAAAVAVSIAGGLLAVVAVFRMAHRRFGSAIAWSSGALVALHPWAVDFSADVMSDGLYAGLFLAALALLVELLEGPSALRAAGFGLVAGLAYLARPEGLVLAVLAGLLFAWRIVKRPGERRGALPIALAAFGIMLLFVGGLRWAEVPGAGAFALSQKKSVAVLLEGGPGEAAIARDRADRREARRDADALPLPEGSIRADGRGEARPARSVAGLAGAAARVVATSLSTVRHEVALFALLGLAGSLAPRRREGRAYERVVLLLAGLQGTILLLLVWGAGYVSRRHALAPGLALLPLAALGWQATIQAIDARLGFRLARLVCRGRDKRAFGAHACAALLVCVLVVCWGPRDLRARRTDRAAERRAAEWLASQSASVAPVAAQKGRTAYYAGAVFVPIPDGRDGTLERQLRGRGAGYLIIDQAKLGDHLGLAEGIGRWLVPLHVERTPGQTVLVLALSPPAG